MATVHGQAESSKMKPGYKKPVGAYVPPAKRVKSEKFDVGSEDYQRCQWDENKKKITGLINRANGSNLTVIVKELFNCNLIRYKGLFSSALIKAQELSPAYTDVYAALLAVINTRIRSLGSLVINRIILNYRQAFLNNNKARCMSLARFVAHLINQEVVHEALGFQMIDHLINRNKPSSASIEIAITLLRECGAKLEILNPRCLLDDFRILRDLSLEKDYDTRTHGMIDMIHVTKKDKFRENPPIRPDLDLIAEDDKVTHSILLTDPKKEDFLMECNYFKYDPKWTENEKKYDEFKKTLLEEDDDYSDDSSDYSDDDEDKDDQGHVKTVKIKEEEDKKDVKPIVIDATGKDLIAFRRTVYLTIRSSISHEEVVHKLLKSKIDPELHDELCQMILDCCGQERTYESICGLTAAKLCHLNRREFAPKFEKLFELFYSTVHRFETIKIRNVAKFYANLLTTESIDWSCLLCLKLRENATSSAGRCFIKFLFTELVAILSLRVLVEYINDPAKEHAFKELFPTDEEQDIRFSINFFTCSGLGELTEKLRQELTSRQENP